MKEFEKWKSQNCEVKSCPHEASCNGCETIWKEALKWTLTKAFEDTFEDLHNWEDKDVDHRIIAVADIEEELKS